MKGSTFVVKAGAHARRWTPVEVMLPASEKGVDAHWQVTESNGLISPVQAEVIAPGKLS